MLKPFSANISTGSRTHRSGVASYAAPAKQPNAILRKIRHHAKVTGNRDLMNQVKAQIQVWQERGGSRYDSFLPGDPLYEPVLKYMVGSWELVER